MKITFEAEYNLGATVYLTYRSEKVKGRVVGIGLHGASHLNRQLLYSVTWEDTGESSEHYEEELTEVYMQDFTEKSDD